MFNIVYLSKLLKVELVELQQKVLSVSIGELLEWLKINANLHVWDWSGLFRYTVASLWLLLLLKFSQNWFHQKVLNLLLWHQTQLQSIHTHTNLPVHCPDALNMQEDILRWHAWDGHPHSSASKHTHTHRLPAVSPPTRSPLASDPTNLYHLFQHSAITPTHSSLCVSACQWSWWCLSVNPANASLAGKCHEAFLCSHKD